MSGRRAVIEDVAQMDAGAGAAHLDTAHAVAAGYLLAERAGYTSFWARVGELFGMEGLGCLHLSDSLRQEGSRIDRHTHIGEGHVGLEAFRSLVNDAALQSVPMILETPKGEDMLEDIRNLALLRGLYVDHDRDDG